MVLVCAGADERPAKASGLPLLHLCLGLGPGGLQRLTLPARMAGCYLGVCDRGMERFSTAICEQLISEAERMEAVGLVVDCERQSEPVQTFLSALDDKCAQRGLPLYVPLSQAECVRNACLIADTAVSGGSLIERFQDLTQRWPGRIAADLRPVSSDFTLPSPNSEGSVLSTSQREALCQRTGAQTFFSRELCARYFTYMDEAGNGHFVLFDDPDTMREKCRCLTALGVRPFFARYPDVKTLITP